MSIVLYKYYGVSICNSIISLYTYDFTPMHNHS